MGFFDEFEDKSAFISEEETRRLVKEEAKLTIVRIKYNAQGKFGPTYFVEAVLDEEPDRVRIKSFKRGTVESRDRQLDAMMVWLREPSNALPYVYLEQAGPKKPILIRDAGTPEQTLTAEQVQALLEPPAEETTEEAAE